MIVAVEADGYVEAVDAFRTGNHAAADAHDTLAARLAGLAGMAGDDASGAEFAAAYDGAAAEALSALREVVASYATLGRLTRTSWDNHRRAEERAILPGGVVDVSCAAPPEASYAAVLAVAPPSSLGGDPPALSTEEALVLDHVEGFVWPDADVDRLREAAGAWRAAGEALDDAGVWCGVASAALQTQRSPEIPLATAAADDLRATVRDLAASCADLGAHCEAYADAVDARRAEIRGLVREILQFVVEGFVLGAVLGAVSVGAGAAVGASSIASRVAAQTPRFAAILAALRATTAGIATSVRTTRTAVAAQRARLERFLRVPARNEAGHLVLGPGRWQPGWLARHEHSGSHTLAKHVGKTPEELLARIRDEGIPRASSFATQADAERIIARSLHERAGKISEWLASDRAKLQLDHWTGSPTGVSVGVDGQDIVNGVRLILRRDPTMSDGFRIHTAFPQP